MPPTVELVYDADCPNVGQARTQLLRAYALTGLPARWREWRRDHEHAPERVRKFGSPTILVNGKDIVPTATDAACCRVYAQADGTMKGVPPVERIASAISDARRGTSWKSAGLWGPALGIAFLPKLICPACWPAYAALVSSAGVPFLLETAFLFPITLVALALVLGLLAWRATERRGYRPMLLGLASSVVVLIGKFGFDNNPAAYAGATALFAACVWNSWPKRAPLESAACPACEPGSKPLP
jgi:mercuric ion transport protein